MANKRRGNNEGTIYQRESGSWRAQVSIDGERLSCTRETREECQDWLFEMRGKVKQGLSYNATQITVKNFFSEWLSIKKTSLRPKTFKQYQQIGRDYITPRIGETKLIELDPHHIQSLYNHHVQKGVGLRTIQLTHAVLHGCLNHALKLGLLGRNPSDAVEVPKPIQKELVVLDENQIQQLLIAVQSSKPDFQAFYQIALSTGMRQGELLGLKWKDCDWDKRRIHVRRQLKTVPNEGLVLTSPKTKSSIRTVIIGKKVWQTLKGHYKFQLQKKKKAGDQWSDKDLIFCEDNGAPIRARKIIREFKELLELAGLPEIRFHDLRHTAATQMLTNGADPITVSKRLGHSKPSTTMDIYGHAVPGMQEDAASIMDDITTPTTINIEVSAPKLHRNCTGKAPASNSHPENLSSVSSY